MGIRVEGWGVSLGKGTDRKRRIERQPLMGEGGGLEFETEEGSPGFEGGKRWNLCDVTTR